MISFVGAGPGDPELITVKGANLLGNADIIIYAGSLVNPSLLDYAKAGCRIFNSAQLDLDQQIEIMVSGVKADKEVVRLHTGDPSIYGAIREQMVRLEGAGIDYQVIPGVSSFCGATATLKRQLTIPNQTQTVILTRMEGRTPVPEKERLKKLAEHQSTMVIFLSIGMIDQVVTELKEHYPVTTPAAVVYKASWPEEKKLVGTLEDIVQLTEEEGIIRTALIFVGEFLKESVEEESLLYSSHFTHGFRDGVGEERCD